MNIEDYFDFVSPDEIKLKGHRIWIEDVLSEYLLRALTLEELVERFDTLTKEQLLAVLLYYHHNRDAMDRYITDWLEYCRRARKQNQHDNPEWYERMRQRKKELDAAQKPQTAS